MLLLQVLDEMPSSAGILPLRLCRQAVFPILAGLLTRCRQLLQERVDVMPRRLLDGEQVQLGVTDALDLVLAPVFAAEVTGIVTVHDRLPLPLSHRADAQPVRLRDPYLAAPGCPEGARLH